MRGQKRKLALYIIAYASIVTVFILIAGLIKIAFTTGSGKLTLENFAFLYKSVRVKESTLSVIWPYLINSLQFSIFVTLVEMFIALMAAYAISRCRFKGKRIMLNSLFLLSAFPSVSLLIPIFYVLKSTNLVNTMLGVVMVKVALGIPMDIYLLKGFFDDIPISIECSSLVDGCTRFKSFYTILLPYIKTGISAVAILVFLSAWGEYIILVSYLFDKNLYPIGLYLGTAMGSADGGTTNVAAAISLIYIIPVIAYYLMVQSKISVENRSLIGKGV